MVYPKEGQNLFPNASDAVSAAILNDAVQCPNFDTCFKWAAVYHNISTILNILNLEKYRSRGIWTNENNRPLLYELEMVLLGQSILLFWLGREAPFLNL